MTDRAVSETLGYVLIFALVTGTIGIVFATGLTGLEGAQQEEKVQNIERAFDVLADNVDDLATGEAPSRATEVKLAGGDMRLGDPVLIEVFAVNDSDPLDNASYSVSVEPIVYEASGGSSIVYTSGAVFRQESAGAVLLRAPGWVVGSERTTLPLLNTGSDGGGGLSGEGAVLVVAQRQSRTLGEPFVADGGATLRVDVTVTSSRVEAWGRYFEDEGYDAVDADPADGSVTYRFDTDALYVPRSTVEVSFDR